MALDWDTMYLWNFYRPFQKWCPPFPTLQIHIYWPMPSGLSSCFPIVDVQYIPPFSKTTSRLHMPIPSKPLPSTDRYPYEIIAFLLEAINWYHPCQDPSPHDIIHSYNPVDLSSAPQSNGTKCRGFNPLIIPPIVFHLENPSINASIIIVPTLLTTCGINYSLISTWCNLITISNSKGIFYPPL